MPKNSLPSRNMQVANVLTDVDQGERIIIRAVLPRGLPGAQKKAVWQKPDSEGLIISTVGSACIRDICKVSEELTKLPRKYRISFGHLTYQEVTKTNGSYTSLIMYFLTLTSLSFCSCPGETRGSTESQTVDIRHKVKKLQKSR